MMTRTETGPAGSAEFSTCGFYRYRLSRRWGEGGGSTRLTRLGIIMLNPSLADANRHDSTVTRCMGFASALGADGLEVRNLFTYRTPYPSALRTAASPVGPAPYGPTLANNAILELFGLCFHVVCAWGVDGGYRGRDREVVKMIADAGFAYRLTCLGLTKHGYPRHPLYLPKTATIRTFALPPLAKRPEPTDFPTL